MIASAKTEFMEKGYAKTSLRKICASTGVTAGAIYFFFQDKEDLFAAIVEKPAAELLDILHNHFQEDGQEIFGLKPAQLADYRCDNLGFIFQFYNLIPNLTVRENIQVCEYLANAP